MKIIICDDEKIFRDKLIEVCETYAKNNDIDLELKQYSSGEELLESSESADVLLLDIEMAGINGIEVKEILEENSRISFIIFTSSHTEMVFDTFSKKTLGFVTKPVTYEKLEEKLNKVLKEIKSEFFIEVQDKENIIKVKNNKICYIEADDYCSRIITTDNTYLVRKSLSEWEDELTDKDFIRIHKSYLVNMDFIKAIKSVVVLDSGEELKIGRTKLKEVKEKYTEFIRKKVK